MLTRGFEDGVNSPEYRTVCGQGRFLIEVAAFQRGNLDGQIIIKSITFDEHGAQLVLQWPAGRQHTVTCPLAADADDLYRTAQQQALVHPPVREPGSDFPADPGQPPLVMFTGLLLDLGTHSDALVTYRLDIGALAFDSIDSDGTTYADVVVRDTANVRYRTRYTWATVGRPIVGDAFAIADTIADGRAIPTHEGYTECP